MAHAPRSGGWPASIQTRAISEYVGPATLGPSCVGSPNATLFVTEAVALVTRRRIRAKPVLTGIGGD